MFRYLWRGGLARQARQASGMYLQPASNRLPTLAKSPAREFASAAENVGTQSNKKKYALVGLLVSMGTVFVAYKTGLVKIGTSDDSSKALTSKGKKEDKKRLPPFATPDSHIPKKVTYLLVGAGTASFAAFRAIKSKDPKAQVLIVGDEEHLPYMRPPLSKELWYGDDPKVGETLSFKQWNGRERSVFFEPEAFFCPPHQLTNQENGGVAYVRGRRVVKLESDKQEAVLENGYRITFEKCLIATGGNPRNLPVFEELDENAQEHVTLFRKIRDFQHLDRVSQKVKSITIVGGGFLGSELACSLGKRAKETGLKIVQVFPESGNMGRVLPEYLSQWTTGKVQVTGVTVIPNVTVQSAKWEHGHMNLKLSNDQNLMTDHVVVAVGLDPQTDLAAESGLEVDKEMGGYLVNSELQARSNIWVAGDAACFYDVKLGRRRVEHHDHAVVSGRLAGENMAGSAGKPYWHQSMFWSDLGPEVGYEAIGVVDASLPTIAVFAKATERDTPRAVVEATGEGLRSQTEMDAETKAPVQKDSNASALHIPKAGEEYGKGVVFYMRENVVVGILLWNLFNRMPIARKVLREGKAYEDVNEVAKLFNIYEEEDLAAIS